jgi:cytochrome P450
MTDPISEAIADPNTCAHPDRYDALFTRIRAEDPVYWATPEGCRPFWALSKHADISEVERQPEIFLSAPRTELLRIVEEERIFAATGGTHHSRTMIHMDGAEHRAYRNMTQIWFMPANLRKLEAGLAQLSKEFVDRLAGMGGECDFVNDIANWYPLRVIMTILGIPPEEEAEIMRLTLGLVGRLDTTVTADTRSETRLLSAAQEIFAYFSGIFDDRRRNPRDDLASIIANAIIEGQPIGRNEALSYYLLIATAGHDTTSATIAGGLLALLQNPAELAKLRANPAFLPSTIDEMLRWVTPVKHFFRTAAADYTLRGKRIKAGDGLMLCFPSANRDEDVYDQPFAFKVDRAPNPQLAFGFGAHNCLGQHLARMEMRAFFKELLPRLGHAELAGPPVWLAVTLSGGLKTLPLKYEMVG